MTNKDKEINKKYIYFLLFLLPHLRSWKDYTNQFMSDQVIDNSNLLFLLAQSEKLIQDTQIEEQKRLVLLPILQLLFQ